MQSPLYRFADIHIFFLHAMTYCEALSIVLAGGSIHIGKIKIENHAAAINGKWQNEICVQIAFIPIKHEVRILPKIVGAVTVARGCCLRICSRSGCFHRARLQRKAVRILDSVICVFKNAVQPFMKMRDVIAAVEIVVDVNLPVAVELIDATLKKMQRAQVEGCHASHKTAEKIVERGGVSIEVDENKMLPGLDAHRHETVLGAVEIAYAIKIGCALQRSVDTVGPAVIGAAEICGMA